MIEGHFARHLRRMRGLYAVRRSALAAALANAFGNRLQIGLQAGGMHLVVRPAAPIPDWELVLLCEKHGLSAVPLSAHVLKWGCGPGLLLSFTNIPEERAETAAASLRGAIGDRLGM